MSKEKYWPQHKVFFVGTLLLFPEKLQIRPIDPWFFSPYFIGGDHNFVETWLLEYKKLGYLEYEKDRYGNFLLTEIHRDKTLVDLKQYLTKWHDNELLSLEGSKPPDVQFQQSLFIHGLVEAYSEHINPPRLKVTDIYGVSEYTPPFWELVLYNALIERTVEILYMDYDRRPDGLYDTDALPLAEFNVIDKKLVDMIKQRSAEMNQKDNRLSNILSVESYDAELGVLNFMGQEIKIIRQKNRQGNKIKEPLQAYAMRKLFKTVNTLNNGVSLASVISVRSTSLDAKTRKRVTNHLAEINRKVSEVTNEDKLIIFDKVNYYLKKSYLE